MTITRQLFQTAKFTNCTNKDNLTALNITYMATFSARQTFTDTFITRQKKSKTLKQIKQNLEPSQMKTISENVLKPKETKSNPKHDKLT